MRFIDKVKPDGGRRTATARVILYTLIGLASIIAPIVLWKLQLPNISSTFGGEYQIFELFGFCASAALGIFAFLEIRRRKGIPFEQLLPIILLTVVSFYYLILIAEYSAKSWDYEFYENAARAVLEGENPYTGFYLYPPLGAQALAQAYRFIETIDPSASPENVWYIVFYLYQCLQFFLIPAAFILCYLFARRTGIDLVQASVFVTILFLLNNPLFRTIRFNQVNLYILVLFLAAILLLKRHPVISGAAAALGGHIKLYPLILLAPWSATKKIAAVVGAVLGLLVVLLILTNFGQNWELWNQFLAFAVSPYEKVQFLVITYFRDNSLHSFIYNLFRTFTFIAGGDEPRFDIASVVYVVAALAVVVWFVFRFLSREKAFGARVEKTDRKTPGIRDDSMRLFGHSMDVLALILIVSPVVWEHQYILAIPLVIWSFALHGFEKAWGIGIAAVLMFAIPTFDIFPFSYHRIVGLVLLMRYMEAGRLPGENGNSRA